MALHGTALSGKAWVWIKRPVRIHQECGAGLYLSTRLARVKGAHSGSHCRVACQDIAGCAW